MHTYTGNDETSGPSSTSSPLASSSESSFRSNSSSSSSNQFSLKEDTLSTHEKPKVHNNAEIVKMGEGLEASVRQENDSVVIDAPGLTKVSAYSNLKRFSLAMEDTNKDWMMHDVEEEWGGERVESGSTVGSVSTGGIFMKIGERTIDKDEEGQRDTLVLQDNDNQVNTFDPPGVELLPPQQSSPSPPSPSPPPELLPPTAHDDLSSQAPEDLSHEPLDHSPSHSPSHSPTPESPTSTLRPSHLRIQSDEDTPPPNAVSNSTAATVSEPSSQEKGPSVSVVGERSRTEEFTEEYSFNEVLRLATGVKPTSSSKATNSLLLENNHGTANSEQNNEGQLVSEVPAQLLDPYTVLNEEQATPRVDVCEDNPFLVSPTTPVPNNTNPFMEGYEEPESPSLSHPAAVVATFGNPFEASATFGNTSNDLANGDTSNFGDSSNPFDDEQHSPPSSPYNPFDEPDERNFKSSSPLVDEKVTVDEQSSSFDSNKVSVNSDQQHIVYRLPAEDFAKIVISENHYAHELSVEEIDVKVSKLKVYLKNDSSNVDLQQALIQLQLLKQKKLEVSDTFFV